MWIKTRLVVFFSALFVGVTAFEIPEEFLALSFFDEPQADTVRIAFESPVVNISWMEKPPYIIFEEEQLEKIKNRPKFSMAPRQKDGEAAANESSDTKQESVQKREENYLPGVKVTGIFQEIVFKGLHICAGIPRTNVRFAKKVDNLKQLDQTIVKKEADLTLPIQGSENGSYGGHTYVEILKSPGVVLIVDKQQTLKHLRERVLQAMKQTLPVVILTLLLTGFAGLVIWGLDTSKNPDHFPHSFAQGVTEGIWWSFVSMTTVGYGDRIPKSLAARLFGIIWILTGLILCSFFTATFTSALTSSSMLHRNSLLGVKVAVMSDSHAYDEALKQAANVKDYPNFHEMYNALVLKQEVEGILADIYTASYYMDKVENAGIAVSMFFSSQRSIGFVVGKPDFSPETGCLRNLFKYRQRDIKKIILRHTQAFHTQTRSSRISDKSVDGVVTLLDGNSPVFWTALYVMMTTFVTLITVGFVYESCAARRRKKRLSSDKSTLKASIVGSSLIEMTSYLPGRTGSQNADQQPAAKGQLRLYSKFS